MEETKNKDNLSDDDFIQNYSKRQKKDRLSEKDKTKNMGFYIFLGITFLIAYYLFSTYYFIPKI